MEKSYRIQCAVDPFKVALVKDILHISYNVVWLHFEQDGDQSHQAGNIGPATSQSCLEKPKPYSFHTYIVALISKHTICRVFGTFLLSPTQLIPCCYLRLV